MNVQEFGAFTVRLANFVANPQPITNPQAALQTNRQIEVRTRV
jgi:hypothetical protein